MLPFWNTTGFSPIPRTAVLGGTTVYHFSGGTLCLQNLHGAPDPMRGVITRLLYKLWYPSEMSVELSPSVVKGRMGDEVQVTCTLRNTESAQVISCSSTKGYLKLEIIVTKYLILSLPSSYKFKKPWSKIRFHCCLSLSRTLYCIFSLNSPERLVPLIHYTLRHRILYGITVTLIFIQCLGNGLKNNYILKITITPLNVT